MRPESGRPGPDGNPRAKCRRKMPAADCSRMDLTSPRPLRLSMASAISFIMGTVSTLCGAWLSVRRAMKLEISNWMYLSGGLDATRVSPVRSGSGAGRVAILTSATGVEECSRDYAMNPVLSTREQTPYGAIESAGSSGDDHASSLHFRCPYPRVSKWLFSLCYFRRASYNAAHENRFGRGSRRF